MESIAVVIPCYNEKNIETTIDSLLSSFSIQYPTQVFVVVNHSIHDSDRVKMQNQQAWNALERYAQLPSGFSLHRIDQMDIEPKHAGVGLARRKGMDLACTVIEDDDVIVNLDADCTVSNNYLSGIGKYFENHPNITGASLYYEHPLHGEQGEAIANYELHLRLYVNGLRYAGFPLAFQTVGSAMAVRKSTYQKQGGMNKRKAGEDFYFIQKLLKVGRYSDLNQVCVFPSDRESDRVPFGTGKAVADFNHNGHQLTYHLEAYHLLAQLVRIIPSSYEDPSYARMQKELETLHPWLSSFAWEDKIKGARANSTDLSSFRKRVFSFFDGFAVMKLMHYLRNHGLPDQPVEEVAKLFCENHQLQVKSDQIVDLLEALRMHDRNRNGVLSQELVLTW